MRCFSDTKTQWSNFFDRCKTVSYRTWNRLLVEMVVFFGFPFLVSGYLYVRVIVALLKQDRRVARNRILTITFILSWVSWVFFWAPNYSITIYLETLMNDSYLSATLMSHISAIGLTQFHKIFTYWIAFSTPVQLLYSHLNPFVYLLVLKKFQEYVKDVLIKIWQFGSSKKIIKENEDRKFYKKSARFTNTKSFFFGGILILLLGILTFIVFCLSIILSVSFRFSCTSQISLRLENSKNLKVRLLNYNKYEFGGRYAPANIRIYCGEQRGTISVDYRRCFIIKDLHPGAFNFTQQLEAGMLNYTLQLYWWVFYFPPIFKYGRIIIHWMRTFLFTFTHQLSGQNVCTGRFCNWNFLITKLLQVCRRIRIK